MGLDTSTTSKHAAHSVLQETGHNGCAFTSRQHPAVEVEFPYYSDKKFEDASDITTASQYPDQTHYVDIYDAIDSNMVIWRFSNMLPQVKISILRGMSMHHHFSCRIILLFNREIMVLK